MRSSKRSTRLTSVVVFGVMMLVSVPFAQEEGAEKVKAPGKTKFKEQYEKVMDMLEERMPDGKYVVSSSSRSSLRRYLQRAESYFEQGNFSNTRNQIDSLFSYDVPKDLSKALKDLRKARQYLDFEIERLQAAEDAWVAEEGE